MFIKDFLLDIKNQDLLYHWNHQKGTIDQFYKYINIIDRLIGPKSDETRQLVKTSHRKEELDELEDYISCIPEHRFNVNLEDHNLPVLNKFINRYSLDLTDYIYISKKGHAVLKPEIDMSNEFYIVSADGYFKCTESGIRLPKKSTILDPFKTVKHGLDNGTMFLTTNPLYNEYIDLLPHLVNDLIYQHNLDDDQAVLNIISTYYGYDITYGDVYHREKEFWDAVVITVTNITESVITALNIRGKRVRNNVIVKYSKLTKGMLDCKSNFSIADMMYITSICDKIKEVIGDDDE